MKEVKEVEMQVEQTESNVAETNINHSKLNIYQKLAIIRDELSTQDIKKSGFQSFAKFNYFTLKDLLPPINALEAKYGLFSYVETDDILATITVIDTDDLEVMPFVLNLEAGKTNMKGQPIMDSSATRTYMTRGCYMSLYNISEGEDAVDASIGKDDGKKPPKGKPEAPQADSPLVIMKALCTEKSNSGKKAEVLKTLDDIAKVKNPNMVKDEAIANKVIEELNKL